MGRKQPPGKYTYCRGSLCRIHYYLTVFPHHKGPKKSVPKRYKRLMRDNVMLRNNPDILEWCNRIENKLETEITLPELLPSKEV